MATHILNKSTVKYRFRDLSLINNYSIVNYARKGLRTKVFYDFAVTIKMPEKSLASLINLSSRTISNYKSKKKLLDPLYSEHLLKLISLYNKGEEIFGNIDEFNYWLKKAFWNSEKKPLDLLNTSGGVDLVMEELNKLAEGYPV